MKAPDFKYIIALLCIALYRHYIQLQDTNYYSFSSNSAIIYCCSVSVDNTRIRVK